MHNQKLPTLCSLQTFLWILLIEREKKKKIEKIIQTQCEKREKISKIRHNVLWIGCELRSDTRERVGRARHGHRCRHSQAEMKQTRN
jgi:hypothetical protein